MKYKVFIPTAGIGSRLGDLTDKLNKALITIDYRPVISHIIEKFTIDTEFVIALGYKGHLVKEFLELAYPEIKFEFVFIDKYEGEGSGLGLTISKCKEYLQCPFIFISNDSYISKDFKIKNNTNWVGYSSKKAGKLYRSIEVDSKGNLKYLHEKNIFPDLQAYIGICGIYNYKDFWKHCDETKEFISSGESYVINKMINETKIETMPFDWEDAGDLDSLKLIKIKSFKSYNILEKENEAIWITNDKVIKYHEDTEFISKRVERANILKDFVAEILSFKTNMYSYKYVHGGVISKGINIEKFNSLLDYLNNFWKKVELSTEEYDIFKDKCFAFYKDKTIKRINLYFEKYDGQKYNVKNSNGKNVTSVFEILEKIDWKYISEGEPVRFHGDLHFENILWCEGKFTLIDWRQDFEGILEYGDIYYDLAKILHGLIISHEIVSKNNYEVSAFKNEVVYDFYRKNINIELEKILKNFVINKGLDYKKVKILTGLIFVNIAGLHHYPYCHLLFCLGKDILYKEIYE